MSTSRSDDGAGVGVAALFARAAQARAEKAAQTPDATVRAGTSVTTCGHCGAPRQREELVCRYCKEAL
jgi:hypothetical protein